MAIPGLMKTSDKKVAGPASLQKKVVDPMAATREQAREALRGLGGIADLGAERIGAAVGAGQEALRGAAQAGLQDIYRQGAAGLAAGQAASGAQGGSAYGAALDAGQAAGQAAAGQRADAALQQAQFGLSGEKMKQDALMSAAGQKLEGLKGLMDLGAEGDVVQRRKTEYMDQLQRIDNSYADRWFGEQEGAASEIEALAQSESNPEVRAWLLQEAQRRRSGDKDI